MFPWSLVLGIWYLIGFWLLGFGVFFTKSYAFLREGQSRHADRAHACLRALAHPGHVAAEFQRGVRIGLLCRRLFSGPPRLVAPAGDASVHRRGAGYLLPENGLAGFYRPRSSGTIVHLCLLCGDLVARAQV